MATTCSECGHVTHETQTDRCVLCKTPFSEMAADANGSQAVEGGARHQQAKRSSVAPDDRNWLVKSIHRRSIVGMLISVLMIFGGAFGRGITRGNVTVTGTQLVLVGVATLVLSLALFFVTKRRR